MTRAGVLIDAGMHTPHAVLGLDLVLRCDAVPHEDRRPLGFLEWCCRW